MGPFPTYATWKSRRFDMYIDLVAQPSPTKMHHTTVAFVVLGTLPSPGRSPHHAGYTTRGFSQLVVFDQSLLMQVCTA